MGNSDRVGRRSGVRDIPRTWDHVLPPKQGSTMRGLPLSIVLICLGCSSREPLQVQKLQLGRTLNPDNSVAGHTSVFKPADTVYVAALSGDKGYGTFKVRWSYEDRLVDEATREVNYRGPAATEFHLQSAMGFPPGDYSVEMFLNGEPIGKRSYRVEERR
jgi:hypothetical protein